MENIKSINKIFQGLQEGIYNLDISLAKMKLLNEQQIYLCEQIQELINQIVGDKQ